MTTLEQKLKKIQALDQLREEEREKMDLLIQKRQQVDKDIKDLEVVLEELDQRIEALEDDALPEAARQQEERQKKEKNRLNKRMTIKEDEEEPPPQSQTADLLASSSSSSMFFSDDFLTDPSSQLLQQQRQLDQSRTRRSVTRVSLESQLTEPYSQMPSPDQYNNDDGIDEQENKIPSYDVAANQTNSQKNNHIYRSASASSSRSSVVGRLEITTVPPKKKKAVVQSSNCNSNNYRSVEGPMDRFIGCLQTSPASCASSNSLSNSHMAHLLPPSNDNKQHSSNFHNQYQTQPHQSNQSNNHYDHNSFPWSTQVQELLQNTFRIQHFREHQREVINCTLSGQDVFVLMRTGGGKSLTYQLPALLEGRGTSQNKITFVISPLLSLIRDQEEQMNQFAPGSAISFTSNLPGGQSEHARRWDCVRDPRQGVCLVLVTPEKVHKSGKLQDELQRLYQQNRLGRFVIDEAHCSSNWGHDFRPDYTQLGVLRQRWPSIPIMAVTATASDRVRLDVCNILQVSPNCAFFRSASNRPNLTYHVRPKKHSWSADAVLDDMAAFIEKEYPRGAGIVYTFSKKDADDVSDMLVERGIVAEAYHSDVSPLRKDLIHQSWMRNETQVVVATIAFGLGINKPDVRFVLHHTLSKSLEAYYQESGRAGRDGKPSQCVLYYSPKDVPRMAKMVFSDRNSNSEVAFGNMIRYAQESGGDAVCRAIINSSMGEAGYDIETAKQMEEQMGLHDQRDVGRHAQTVVRLLEAKIAQRQKMTLSKLVTEWRKKDPEPCVAKFPPGNDLNADECERVIISLLMESVLRSNIRGNAYGANCYLELGRHGSQFLASSNPRVLMSFPKRDSKDASKEGVDDGNKKSPAETKAKKSGKTGTRRKKKTATKRTTTSKRKQSAITKKRPKIVAKRKASTTAATSATRRAPGSTVDNVIELIDSDDENDFLQDTAMVARSRTSRPRVARQARAAFVVQQDEHVDDISIPEEEDGEFEFD